MSQPQPWELQARKAKNILENSIPRQWLLPDDKLPPADEKSVMDFPRKSGLLTERELDITELSATALVEEMGADKLSAEEVVVAFLKRSVLGHNLVCALESVDKGCLLTLCSSILQRSLWRIRLSRELKSLMNIIERQGS